MTRGKLDLEKKKCKMPIQPGQVEKCAKLVDATILVER
jgi:hypothetical protein